MRSTEWAWVLLPVLSVNVWSLNSASAQSIAVDDPIVAAQMQAGLQSAKSTGRITRAAAFADPIEAAQVLAAAEKTFPNLAADLDTAHLLSKAADDPSMRGNLRGRIAEEDWLKRNASDGWRKVKNPNAKQNDGFRFVNGKLEGVQVKVHNNWRDYIGSMRTDNKSELFVLPDDHFELVYKELETRRIGALRGGLTEKAAEYARQQQRLVKLGRTFPELDGAVAASAKHYARIANVLRAAGKAASFVGVALAVLDGGIAIYEVATGKAEVDELVARLGKIAIGGTAAWVLGDAAAAAAVAAGATGAVPVAVAIIVGTATFLVVDWSIDAIQDSLRIGQVTGEEVKRLWPEGARGVPLDRLYRKPADPAVVPK